MNEKPTYLIHYGVKKEKWSPEARARFDSRHNRKHDDEPDVKTKDGHIYSLNTGKDNTKLIENAHKKNMAFAEYAHLRGFGYNVARDKHYSELERSIQNKRRKKQLAEEFGKNRTKVLADGRTLHSRRRNPNGKVAFYGYHWGKTTPVHDGSWHGDGKPVGNGSYSNRRVSQETYLSWLKKRKKG